MGEEDGTKGGIMKKLTPEQTKNRDRIHTQLFGKKVKVKGKDWDAWAWQFNDGRFYPKSELTKLRKGWSPCDCHPDSGYWVRVKFVEVK